MGGMAGNGLGNSMMRMGSRLGGSMPTEQSNVGYTPVTPNVYGPAFASQQSAQAPQATSVSPIVQQMAQRIQMQNSPFNFGLQSLYGANRPAMMPMYQNPALAYRPNIQQVQQNLSRVKPSVYKTELDAARERIAEFEAAEEARRTQEQNNTFMYG